MDLLVVEGENLYPIEIKKSKSPVHPDKNFKVLEKLHLKVQPGIVICMSSELVPYNRQTWLMPAAAL